LSRDSQAGESVYFVTGNSTTASGKAGGVLDSDISSCSTLFAEWDDKSIEWQLQAWRELGLPEPSAMALTGGTSVHCYWVLTEALPPDQWRVLQIRLIQHCGSDPACKNPSRVMRLPGFAYIDKKTGKPNGHTAEVVHTSTARYSAAEIEACLPSQLPPPPAAAAPAPARGLPHRTLQEIEAAAAFIPERVVGGNTYETCRNALCGCAAALAEIGLPEEQALDLLASKWPDRATAQQVLESCTTREAASFWAIAKEHGYQLSSKASTARQQQAESRVVPGPKGGDAAPGNEPPASWGDLIGQLPDGWVVTERGTFPSKLSAGHLARMLERKQDLFRYNELTMFCEVHTRPGWCAVVDAELDSAYVLLSQKGWIIGAEPITKAVCHVARLRSFHPVKQYLLGLEQKPSVEDYNLDEVAPRFFRANDPLHVAMVRKWLIGAVARAMNPGCQMDYCLVLQSRQQGLMKSTSFRDLASPDWFTSTVPDADKDFLLNVHSCWIFELAELESVTGKRDAGRLKNLITTSVDTFRVPYGRTAERRLRGSVFCGTVNEDSFLKDPTGNRRYWVVPIEGSEPLDREGLKAARDGIWKAAMAAWRAGELPMLTRAQEALSEIQNETFVQSDPWLAMLDLAITETPRQWQKPFSTAQALMAAKLKNGEQISRADETRIAPLLRRLGFEKAKNPATTDDGKRVRLWSAAQPAQPCTTSNGGGCAPPEPLQQNGSQRAAQPAQPIHSERLKRGEVEPAAVGDQWGELPYVGETVVQVVHPPLEPLAQQGFDPAQPLDLGVVQVVQGCAPATPPSWPTWGDALLQLRAHHPDHLPAQLANLLHAQRGIHTDGRTVKALLTAWDQRLEVA
jgi:hypothetical protein